MARGNTIGSVYVRVRPRVSNFRRDVEDKLKKEFSKPVELQVDAKIDTRQLNKDAIDAARKAGKKATIRFDADFDGVDSALRAMQRKLKDLQGEELELTANTSGVEEAIDKLRSRKYSGIKVEMEYSRDEAGYQAIMDQIDRIRQSKITTKIRFDSDEESLAATQAWARRRLRQARLKAPIEFTYSDDASGRRSLLEHLEEIRKERRELEFVATLDDSELDGKIRQLRNEQVSIKARTDLASMAAAEGQLAMLARDRWAEIKPRISKRAMATLQGSFMAIAGINSIGHLIRQIEDIALNFDDMAVAGAAAGAAIGSLVSIGTVGLGALLNIGRETLQTFQGLAMAPTLLLSGATALQTWTAVWNNFGDAIEGDADALARIPENGKQAVAAIQELDETVNRTVQNNFWGEMTDEVERFTERIGPHVVEAMGNTASIMGRTISSMLDHTEALSRNGSLEAFTENNTILMDQLGVAAETAFQTLMNMGIVGSRYLPVLGAWINDLAIDFSRFMNEALRTGAFDSWVTNSIKSIQSLGRFAKGTWDMLGGLARAFDNVDGAGLHEMADGMERISNWVNSSGTQRRLESFFQAAMDGASNAGRGLGDLIQTVWEMEDAINSLLRQTGQLAGDFMTQISRIDFSVVTRGITDLMDGMIDFVNRAGPGFESIANIFGRLASIGGEVAREIAHGLNLTMGAIDGFIARIEGPLINAIHPLTRVFEDLAAMGTPILFALADSVGVLLNAFAALPAPIQNVITLLAIMGRTGIGTAVSKVAGQFGTMRTRVNREMALLATQVPGYFNTAAGSVERRAVVMSTRVQARMNVLRQSLSRTFGAGGLLGALGGGWGIAIAGGVAALSALAGASAEAEAAQQRLGETLDEVTGAMTQQTEVALFESLNKEYSKFDNYWNSRPLSATFESEAEAIGLSIEQIVQEMTRGSGSAEEFVGVLDELYSAWASGNYDTAELQDLAIQLGYTGDVSKITSGNMRAMGTVLGEVRPLAGGLADELDNAYDRITKTGGGIRSVEANVSSFAPAIQDLAGAFEVLGDGASTSAERVDALRTSLEGLGSKDALTSLEMDIRAEELAREVTQSIETALANETIDYDNLFKGGELNPKSGHARLVLDSVDTVYEEMLNRINSAQQTMSEADFDSFLEGVPAMWRERGQEVAEALKIPEEHMDAFMKTWNSVEFDEHDIKFSYEAEGMMDRATQDFIRLNSVAEDLDEQTFYARLGFEEGESFTKMEYAQALADVFNETRAEAEISADSDEFQEMLDRAIESGLYFDGEQFVAALDADGQPAQAALDQAEARGYAFDGEDFVAVANVKTDQATDNLEAIINKSNTQWNGEEYIAMLNADGTPTEEGLAHAEALGLAWHNGRFVAIVDANGEHADAEITARREQALRYEGVYNALLQTEVPNDQLETVAQAIAANESFEGDYIAFLEALRTESGKAAIEEAVNDLDGIDEEVKTELIALFTGKPIIEEAKADKEELDGSSASVDVDVNYDATGATEAKNDKAEIQDHPALSQVDSSYNSQEANKAKLDKKELDETGAEMDIDANYAGEAETTKAKDDAAEVDNLAPILEIDSEYTGDGTSDAKGAAEEIDNIKATFEISAEYDASVAADAKTDAEELDGTRVRFKIDSSYAGDSAQTAKDDAAEIDGLTAEWTITADSSASDEAISSTKTGLLQLNGASATPSISVEGAGAVQSQVQAAIGAMRTYAASSAVASISLAGAGAVVSQAMGARAALMQTQGNYLTRLMTVGGPQVVSAARQALAANQRVDDVFTTRLRTTGGPQVVSSANNAYQASMRMNRAYTAVFQERGSGAVIGRAYAVRSAINSINLNPVVTFGGRVARSLNAAAARVRNAAAYARAAAALSADGSLSNSRFKPRIEYFNDGGVNFTTKPTRAHIAPAGSYVMYAEKETGGEAFIPLAASKRDRSVAIWKETGRRLNVYADGDITGDSGATAGGDIYNINVRQADAGPKDIVNELTHQSRRNRRR